jgi:D-alanine transaminase
MTATPARIVYLDGRFVDATEARVSPDDRGFLFGDGVYEVTPAYGGRFFRLDEHLARLRRNLGEVRIAGAPGDADADALVRSLADVSHELLARNGLADAERALVYVQVTRGAAWPRTHAFPRAAAGVTPTVYAYAAPWAPKIVAEAGATAVTVDDVRWARCDIKTIALLANCIAAEQAREAGADEGLFVRRDAAGDGVVLEGTHTNLFAVIRGNVVTAPTTAQVLPGVTREAVLALCRAAGIPCHEAPILLAALGDADEVFLTGTTTEVTPLVQVDGRPVGDGRPGPVTRRVRALFHDAVARETGRGTGSLVSAVPAASV